jgi:hypothetical protein
VISRLAPPENSFQPRTLAQWRRWLTRHHGRCEGMGLVTLKKAPGKARSGGSKSNKERIKRLVAGAPSASPKPRGSPPSTSR